MRYGAWMLVSVSLADVGARRVPGVLRSGPEPAQTPGLVYADSLVGADLGGSLLPRPRPGRAGLLAVWEDEAALDAWAAGARLAQRLAPGWTLRMQPVRASGAWSGMGPLLDTELPVADDEPVAVLTYGRLRKTRLLPFLRASATAEGEAVANPAVVASTALARPPHIVSTFSLWRSAAEMREYAYRGEGHTSALRAVRESDFHHESIFVRFRITGGTGRWDGIDLSAYAGAHG